MKSIINELWHGNIIPQEDSRNNSPEMKELIEYMVRHYDDLYKTMMGVRKNFLRKFRSVEANIQDLTMLLYLSILKIGTQFVIITIYSL
jgi:hypothetical protein